LGRILNTHYNTKEKVTSLIDNGDMSSCWTNDSWTTDMSGCNRVKEEEYGPQYYSQRGDNCPPRIDVNLIEYLGDNEEYAYLFTNGEWVCYELGETPKIVEIPNGALAV
jgi:NADH:ubiquinone oxidoreductase subunit